MQKMTTKNRLAVTFAGTVFVFLFTFSIAFVVILRSSLLNNVRSSVSEEAYEIIENHVLVDQGKITFVEDAKGNTLDEEIAEYGFSGLFLDTNLSYVAGYGLFGFYNDEDKESVKKIVDFARQAKETKQPAHTVFTWNSRELFVFFAPIKSDQDVFGVAVIANPTDQVQEVIVNALLVFLGMAFFTLIGSLLLGYVFADRAFAPLTKFIKVVNKIDLNSLTSTVNFKGSAKDEFAILADRFNQMLKRLKVMSTRQKEFISNASHELKTPLTRSISSIDLIARNNPSTMRELKEVRNDLFEINDLLDNLLKLARSKEELMLPGEKIKVVDLTVDILRDVDKQIKAKKITVNLKLETGLTILFPRDYARIIFTNIISNAIKYSPKNSKVLIVGARKAGGVEVSIKDFGIGMTSLEQKKAFDRFYRARGSRKYAPGHGVGLSVVKRICDLFGVKIKIVSEKKIGTEVKLVFN